MDEVGTPISFPLKPKDRICIQPYNREPVQAYFPKYCGPLKWKYTKWDSPKILDKLAAIKYIFSATSSKFPFCGLALPPFVCSVLCSKPEAKMNHTRIGLIPASPKHFLKQRMLTTQQIKPGHQALIEIVSALRHRHCSVPNYIDFFFWLIPVASEPKKARQICANIKTAAKKIRHSNKRKQAGLGAVTLKAEILLMGNALEEKVLWNLDLDTRELDGPPKELPTLARPVAIVISPYKPDTGGASRFIVVAMPDEPGKPAFVFAICEQILLKESNCIHLENMRHN
ncbi:hypothetical protein L345_00515, partial [Ophiophagus hannah]